MTDENSGGGYGKPPKKNQFKKGQSGNPGGRPKKMKGEKEILTALLGKKRTVQTAEGPVQMEGLELLSTRLFKDALDGKVGQTKTLLSRIDSHGIGREDEAQNLTDADARIADQYIDLFKASQKARTDV